MGKKARQGVREEEKTKKKKGKGRNAKRLVLRKNRGARLAGRITRSSSRKKRSRYISYEQRAIPTGTSSKTANASKWRSERCSNEILLSQTCDTSLITRLDDSIGFGRAAPVLMAKMLMRISPRL